MKLLIPFTGYFCQAKAIVRGPFPTTDPEGLSAYAECLPNGAQQLFAHRKARFPRGAAAVFLKCRRGYEVASVVMPEELFRDGPITAPFAEPNKLRSRDIWRLLNRAWPFIRPYRRDLVRLFILLMPGAAGGLFGFVLIRIFFDVIGNGQPLTQYEAWLLRLPLN